MVFENRKKNWKHTPLILPRKEPAIVFSTERLEELIDQCEAREALEEMNEIGTRPWDEVKKELGI